MELKYPQKSGGLLKRRVLGDEVISRYIFGTNDT
jgi:hypothetical protein